MEAIISKVRDLINDILQTNGRDVFEYITSKVFTLSSGNVESSSIKVYKNGTLWAGTNYTYDDDTASITVTGTITVGDVLTVTYSYYQKYSENEISGFIRAALYRLSVEQFGQFIIVSGETISPVPTVPQENLIALVASILISGNVRSYRTPEINLVFGESLSVEQKIKSCISKFSKNYGTMKYVDLDYTWEVYEDQDSE